MRIGELARATGTAVDTIRHYEREGLLPPPPRSAANYRRYGAEQVERLALIRRCRALDMSLDEVRALLRLHDDPQASCAGVNALLDAHLAHVDARLRELLALREALQALQQRCTVPGGTADCGILRSLHEDAPAPAARGTHLPRSHRSPGD